MISDPEFLCFTDMSGNPIYIRKADVKIACIAPNAEGGEATVIMVAGHGPVMVKESAPAVISAVEGSRLN